MTEEVKIFVALFGFMGAMMGSISTFFGLKLQFKRMQKEFDKHREETVKVPYCNRCLSATNAQLTHLEGYMSDIHSKQDRTLEKLNQIIGKLDN